MTPRGEKSYIKRDAHLYLTLEKKRTYVIYKIKFEIFDFFSDQSDLSLIVGNKIVVVLCASVRNLSEQDS